MIGAHCDSAVAVRRAVLSLAVLAMAAVGGSCGGGGGHSPAVGGNSLSPVAAESGAALEGELARLAELQTPQGTDQAVFSALKAELANMLRSQGVERFVSAPPTTAASSAQLDWNGDTNTLNWGYCNVGDYNQNSQVEVADITPLGVNWQVRSPGFPQDFAYSTALAVVDGNSNGLIEIADITPIGQNYLARVTAYNVYASAALADYPPDAAAGNGGASWLGAVPFPAETAPKDQRRTFSFQVVDPQPETYFWVRPTDGSSEGTPSSLYFLAAPDNDPPVASLTADPLLGDIPMAVDFNASASHDPDGEIVKYEWDWDGAESGWLWEDSGTSPTIQHTYDVVDAYSATLRVTDDAGGMNLAQVTINATAPGNDPPVAVLTANPLSGDLPLMVTFDAASSYDIDGSIQSYEWDLDGDGIFGQTSDEAEAAGNPLATYTYTFAGSYEAAVRVSDDADAQASNSVTIEVAREPTNDWVFVTLDTKPGESYQGWYEYRGLSLSLINGKPAVCYFVSDQSDQLEYIYSPTPTGIDSETWQGPVTVLSDSGMELGIATELAEVAGHPAIVYAGETLKYVRASTSEGANAGDWNQVVEIAPWNNQKNYSLAIVAGNPALAYVNEHLSDVIYRRATSSTGSNTADWQQAVVAYSGEALVCDLDVVEDRPAILFWEAAGESEFSSKLRYTRSATSTGTGVTDWNSPVVLTSSGNPNGSASLEIVAGNPAVVYQSDVEVGLFSDIKYTRSTTRAGGSQSDWIYPLAIDHFLNSEFRSSNPMLIVVDENPAYAYIAFQNVRLSYQQAAGDGTNQTHWSEPSPVADIPIEMSEHFPALNLAAANVNGNPAFVYREYDQNQGAYNLKYVYYDRNP